MTRDLVRTVNYDLGEVTYHDPNEPADLVRLDQYEPDGVSQEEAGIDAIATISAGYRGPGNNGHSGSPVVSRDGTIYVDGLPWPAKGTEHPSYAVAPGLIDALEANGRKRLTIAFTYDNPNAFVQSSFRDYSSTELRAFGDQDSITVLVNGRYVSYAAGTSEYRSAIAACKVNISIYVALAAFTEDGGAEVRMPDGMRLYRIRTTSRNTMRNFAACLKIIRQWTHGPIAGIPIDVWLDNRDVVGPDGKRHQNTPTWAFAFQPPGGITSRTMVPMLSAGVEEGKRLALPVPREETLAIAAAEGSAADVEPTERDVQVMRDGGLCDARYWERIWFSSVRDTPLQDDDARAAFLLDFTTEHFPADRERWADSLAIFLSQATEADASTLIAHLVGEVAKGRVAAQPERTLEGVAAYYAALRPEPTKSEPKIIDAEPVRQPTLNERIEALQRARLKAAGDDAEKKAGERTNQDIKDAAPARAENVEQEVGPGDSPSPPTDEQRAIYERQCRAAAALEIDLVEYELAAGCSGAELAEKSTALGDAITKAQKPEGALL